MHLFAPYIFAGNVVEKKSRQRNICPRAFKHGLFAAKRNQRTGGNGENRGESANVSVYSATSCSIRPRISASAKNGSSNGHRDRNTASHTLTSKRPGQRRLKQGLPLAIAVRLGVPFTKWTQRVTPAQPCPARRNERTGGNGENREKIDQCLRLLCALLLNPTVLIVLDD
ncbi:hypothetical protein Pla52o_47820 [Novipirellula galeiformis]|uniref:Uncharacterized protein n=1 Tax=Novipirellula galeiformis TaxID=2528004 RepID=A0A5C6C841_9BACT|nr:hypothetical protein Pla52o_47820 [Novipirellula galeiformis]